MSDWPLTVSICRVVQTLDRILDRGHLAANKERPYAESGVG